MPKGSRRSPEGPYRVRIKLENQYDIQLHTFEVDLPQLTRKAVLYAISPKLYSNKVTLNWQEPDHQGVRTVSLRGDVIIEQAVSQRYLEQRMDKMEKEHAEIRKEHADIRKETADIRKETAEIRKHIAYHDELLMCTEITP